MHFGFSYMGLLFLIMLMIVAVIVLGIGHIGIHLAHRGEINDHTLFV